MPAPERHGARKGKLRTSRGIRTKSRSHVQLKAARKASPGLLALTSTLYRVTCPWHALGSGGTCKLKIKSSCRYSWR